jgi:hypothetical protein
MDIISYIHKSVALLFQILELVEVWTRRSMELTPWSIFPANLHQQSTGVSYLPPG